MLISLTFENLALIEQKNTLILMIDSMSLQAKQVQASH